MKRLITGILVAALLGAGGLWGYRWYEQRSHNSGPSYRMGTVQRQDVVWTISATGTIVPEDVVDVGTQVNGQIASFGNDTDGKPVDYRSTVKENSILAKIDDAIYAAQVEADEAALTQANAAVQVAEATRTQAGARLDQTQRDWARAQKLGESQALSQVDYDASKSNFEQATAGLALADAQIVQARAQVGSAEAALLRSRRNLFYCTILSPVDGVIIDRRVDIGQTVVSSLNAPSLFLIAKDLARMQVLVQVNEADIGHVAPGEAVTFTCDAFPGDHFTGTVRKVRLNATMTQNVVTYTVEIVTDNSQLRLLPYLTANVRFILGKREQVLTAPNAALRWSPSGAITSGTDPASAPGAPRNHAAGSASQRSGATSAAPPAQVWVVRDSVPTPIGVQGGISDGTVTEIATDELKEGDEVIIAELSESAGAPAGSTNPFAPQIFRRRANGAQPSGTEARRADRKP